MSADYHLHVILFTNSLKDEEIIEQTRIFKYINSDVSDDHKSNKGLLR